MARSPVRRALLIDAMGTLIELRPPAPILRRELRDRIGIDVTLEQAQRGLVAEIAYYRAHMLQGRDPASVAELRTRCAAALGAALPAAASVDPAALTDALLASLRFVAHTDAAPALRAARRRGERVVVVSNWDASLPAALASAGLAPLIDAVLTSAEAGAAKPHAAIFARALMIAGVAPEAALHVGDSLVHDVQGARRAQIASVWCNRRGKPVPDGVRAIVSLAELDEP
ncbi:MAG: HAD family hydrolase [Actinomycetota bacterium]|nr:HAD family hydrolase [Actinomycetota bacterium]